MKRSELKKTPEGQWKPGTSLNEELYGFESSIAKQQCFITWEIEDVATNKISTAIKLLGYERFISNSPTPFVAGHVLSVLQSTSCKYNKYFGFL